MQEIKKSRIVLASVLKPVDDTRMLEKLAMSLHDAGYSDIHVIGYPSQTIWEIGAGITLHPLGAFKRLSIRRILASAKILLKAIKLKPALFIATTHELLFTAFVLKAFTKCCTVYDVQEDYYKNILWTNTFPSVLRYPIAVYVRAKEKILSPFFDAFFLAEKCYRQDLSFVARRHVLLENKCIIPKNFVRTPAKTGTILLFTGTLAESTGIFRAIDLAEKLHRTDATIRLHIVGYCPLPATWKQLLSSTSDRPYIKLSAGRAPQPHDAIMAAISHAHFGIICYPPAPHTQNKTPTKLFEYLACELPILLQNNTHMTALAASVDGAISVDFDHIDAVAITKKMASTRFYSRSARAFIWDAEANTMVRETEKILRDWQSPKSPKDR